MTPPAPTPPNRAHPLFIVGIVVLLIPQVALSLLLAMRENRDPAYIVGAVFGSLAVTALIWLIIYWIARALGKTPTTAAMVRIAFAAAVLTFLGQMGRLAGNAGGSIQRATSQVVTDSERMGLTISSDSIRHARFGFALPDPGPSFRRDSAVQHGVDSAAATQRGMVTWVLISQDRGEAIFVQVVKVLSLNEVTFRDFVTGMREGSSKTPRQVLLDSLTWRGSDGEFRLEAQSLEGVYFQSRCLPNTRSSIGLIVCVQTVGRDRSDLEFVRSGLAFANP